MKVSIVLPVYNQAHYLVSALQSIFTQTFTDFELIVVNDGSTDATPTLLASLSQEQRIRVITQTNQGLPAALNAGFSEAKGEYLTWTSADNLVTPIWLEGLVSALDKSPKEVGYAFGYYAGIDDDGKILFVNRDPRFDIPSLLMRNSGNASFLYRASLAQKVGPYDVTLTYAEDLDMWVRMAEQTRAVLVESIAYYYRLHKTSMTAQQDKVREATKRVVQKYLAKTQGKFEIDALFPHIQLSDNPALERWKSRVWLATLGGSAHFYSPVDALVDQLKLALQEHYQNPLVADIVHLYAKESRWQEAAEIVRHYQQEDHSDYLKNLAAVVENQSRQGLDQFPYTGIDENQLAIHCRDNLTPQQRMRNLTSTQQTNSIQILLMNLVSQLQDKSKHLNVWKNIGTLQSPEEKTLLNDLANYLAQLLAVPQAQEAVVYLETLSHMCGAYLGAAETAKEKLNALSQRYPGEHVVLGALDYITQNQWCVSC